MKRGAVLFAAFEAVLLVAVPVLAWIGFRTVLDTTSGQAVDPELDPDEPGYEAFLEPTPVALTYARDAAGSLSWVTVLGLGGPSEEGGSVIYVPPATVSETPELGAATLAEAFAADGQAGLVAAAGEVLGAGFTEVIGLEPTRVAELFAPVSPLPVLLSDEVPGFDAGELELDGAEVTQLLEVKAEAETDLARLVRHEEIWRSWLEAVAASTDPNVVPGERSSGIGRYVRGLAAGPVTYDVVPVTAIEPADDTEAPERFEPDLEAAHALVDDRVPFPVAARPGERLRVRVLDGVGGEGLALRAARDAVRAGGQVTVIGNADRFDAQVSRLVFFDAALADDVAELAAAFGIDEVERADGPNPNDVVDVTVVVGLDLAEAYGLPGG